MNGPFGGKPLFLIAAIAFLLLVTALLSHHGHVTPDSWNHITFFHGSQRSLDGRLAHAEALWNKSVEDRKTMSASFDGGNRKFPDEYFFPFHPYDFIRPTFFCPHDIERVGSIGDGGKWICGMSRYEKYSLPPPPSDPAITPAAGGGEKMVIYSFGVSDDSTFESEMLSRTNSEIWGYDYSVSSWAHQMQTSQLPRAHFNKIGIGRVTDKLREPPFYSVKDLMAINGHDYIDIMKMDIEGAEFDALSSLMESFGGPGHELPVGQLLLEVHLGHDDADIFHMPKTLHAWLDWWAMMEAMGLREVWNEHNWIGDSAEGQPRYIEYTMINTMGKDRNLMLRE